MIVRLCVRVLLFTLAHLEYMCHCQRNVFYITLTALGVGRPVHSVGVYISRFFIIPNVCILDILNESQVDITVKHGVENSKPAVCQAYFEFNWGGGGGGPRHHKHRPCECVCGIAIHL